jgi:hypothetical protein
VTPCSLNGGSLSLSNLPGSGTATTKQSTAGDVTYTLTCGPADNNGSATATVQYTTPSVLFYANGTDRRLGEAFYLHFNTAADTCTPSGGAASDGWANTSFKVGSTLADIYPQVSSPGTYTYTLICSSGLVSVARSVTVTFENNAPYVTAPLSQSTVTLSDTPADYVTIKYNSNLSGCSFSSVPDLFATANSDGSLQGPPLPQGEITLAPSAAGTYQLSLNCYGPDGTVALPPTTLTVLAPPTPTATITFKPSLVVAGEPFQVFWTSTNASGCTQTGGIPGGSWGSDPSQLQAATGTVAETAVLGQFTFGLNCQSIDSSVASGSIQATLDVIALSATLTTSPSAVTEGGSFTLTWSSTGASSCAASGGGANGSSWSGSLGPSGTATQTATADGTFTYMISCYSAGNVITTSKADVTVSAATSTGGSSGGGGGGGGALGVLELALLGAARTLRRRPRPAASRHSS